MSNGKELALHMVKPKPNWWSEQDWLKWFKELETLLNKEQHPAMLWYVLSTPYPEVMHWSRWVMWYKGLVKKAFETKEVMLPRTVGYVKAYELKKSYLIEDKGIPRFPTQPSVRKYLTNKLMQTNRPKSVMSVFMGWRMEDDSEPYSPYLDRILNDPEYRREEILRLLPEGMIRLEVLNLLRLDRHGSDLVGWVKDTNLLEKYMTPEELGEIRHGCDK